MALIQRTTRPALTDTRSVFIHIQYGWDKGKALPRSLDSLEWREWIKCTPESIENGTAAGLAAHRAFHSQGGPKMFRGNGNVDALVVDVFMFDPAQHKKNGDRILEVAKTSYRFTPQ